MKRANSSGFTLVEILVVLIIVGMVSSILLQALSQIYRLQGRFGQQLAQSQEGAMYADWFRQVIQGLQTDYPLGKDIFTGTETSLQGLSISPLSSDGAAGPTNITLKLVDDGNGAVTHLQYESAGQKTPLFVWPGKAVGKFIYVDAEGERHAQWPPALGEWPELPTVILLQTLQGGDQRLLAAVPRGSKEPKLRPLRLGEL